MVWADVIAAILKAVGPLIGDVMAKWLEKLLNKAAKGLPRVDVTNVVAVQTVLSSAADAIPRRQVIRRALVRKLLDHSGQIDGAAWAKADRAEVRELAAHAAAE